jgi:eukaryotic-like serine/threonine-protein kinase
VRTGQLVGGRYRLVEQVGAGGMGVVWRAIDEKRGRAVAIKRAVRPADAGSERADRRMQREARIAAGLHHPHIVEFIDEVVEGHQRWLVMEYVPSQSLSQILKRFGPLNPQQATHLGVQIASALEAVHAKGIVHRDIKPGNVLVTDDGTAKLSDFGISRPICGDVTATDSGLISGTVAFLASEVAGGEEPTPASDVFALGATLFAAVEGIPPFGAADNPLLVLRRAAAGDLEPFRRSGPLAPVLSALLQPDPAKRPDAAHARQLLQELAATWTSRAGSEPFRWPRARRSRRLRRRIAVAALACVTTLATVAGLLVFRTGSSTLASPLPVLGDPRTADPCALTDAHVLSRFGNGTTTYESAYGNFNRCDVIVTLSGGASVQVKVELEKPGSPQGAMEKRGALRIFREPQSDDECNQTVQLADRNRVTITAKLRPGLKPGSADLCAVAGAATDYVNTKLDRGAIPRRSTPFDTASLARMDACTLLDSPTLTRVLGTDVSGPQAGFGNWACSWNSNTSKLSVRLAFDRNVPLTAADGRRMDLGGHTVYLSSEADEPDCLAQVVQRRDFDENGKQADEHLRIIVRGPQTPDQLCRPATELAAVAAATLPPPS